MKLYLVRHGEALDKFIDSERPLSEKGQAAIKQLAINLGQRKVYVEWLWHSGIQRAEETAHLLVKQISNNALCEIDEQLCPEEDPLDIAKKLNAKNDNGMIVGHLPHLGILVAHLLRNCKTIPTINFSPGTIYCLKRENNKDWQFCWKLDP